MATRIAIVGLGQTYHKTRRPDVNLMELWAEAVRIALEDAQLKAKDIDTWIISNMEFFEMRYLADMWAASELSFVGKPGVRINTMGTSGSTAACVTFNHVASGLFDTALVVGGQKHDQAMAQAAMQNIDYWWRQFSAGAVGNFARRATDYMWMSGCTEEHFAITRVKQDKCALKNPYAHLRYGLTVEDVMKSKVLCWPMRLHFMCPTSTGACAFIVASEEKAKKITTKPVWVEDWMSFYFGQAETYAENPSASSLEIGSNKIYKRNSITDPRKEIDVFELYEPSSNAELKWIEEVHLCERGTAWKLMEKGVFGIEDDFPVNPSGGVTCTNPISATPLIRIAEAALQIREDAGEHQVTRPVKRAMATAYGGAGESGITLLRKSL